MKRFLWIVLAAFLLTACDKGFGSQFWDEAPLKMEQHQYKIEAEVLSGLYWHWNNAYASFVESWPEAYSDKKDAEFVLSNRRWYPAEYGPLFWRDFDLDNKLYPGDDPISYYDCDTHPFVKTDLGDGSYRIEVDFLGYHWIGILTPGQDCILKDGSDEFRLRLLPVNATYDHSLDDLIQVARQCGKQKGK